MLALIGASTALEVSDIPFHGPIAGVRVGRIDGQLVINPMASQQPRATSSSSSRVRAIAIVMVEGGAQMLSEDAVLDALYIGHRAMQPILDLQAELRSRSEGPSGIWSCARSIKRWRGASATGDAADPCRAGVERESGAQRGRARRAWRGRRGARDDTPEREREIKGLFEDVH